MFLRAAKIDASLVTFCIIKSNKKKILQGQLVIRKVSKTGSLSHLLAKYKF